MVMNDFMCFCFTSTSDRQELSSSTRECGGGKMRVPEAQCEWDGMDEMDGWIGLCGRLYF
jgi:hypothetical protein